MSSNRLYVGPFGRLPPLPESSTPVERPDSRGTPVGHGPYQLPPPKAPSPLQFGTDTTPLNSAIVTFDSRPRFLITRDPEMSSYKETLPSVSELLTPGSHSSVPVSPFSPQYHQDSPAVERPLHSSPVREQNYHALTHSNNQRPQYTAPPPSYFRPAGPVPNQQAVAFPPYPSQVRSWSNSDELMLQRQNSGPSFAPQTVQYHQGQLPYQTIISNGVSRSPSFHVRSVNQSEHSGGQRIPRVVAEEHVPGEGLCYIYEDGSHCRKIIDGEVVNATWGVTKAGKPRKRLAQACMTCREKKIKCDPNTPKCVQCQKFGRDCRFESAPRGNQPSSVSPSYRNHSARPSQTETFTSSPSESPRGIPGPPPFRDETETGKTAHAVAPERPQGGDLEHILHPYSPKARPRGDSQEESSSPKRKRLGSSSLSESTLASKGKDLLPTKDFEPAIMTVEGAPKTIDPVIQGYQKDPYSLEPDLTLRYMDLYFTRVNQGPYCMFPRKPFFDWLKTCKRKSPDDIMVIYAMLAMGSIFTPPGENKTNSKLFCNIARYAIEKNFGNFSLQLVQSRLLVALLHFALGESARAWDYCGSALRAVCALKFNTEAGINDLTDDQIPEYGLTRDALAECQRRTFWSAYIMDRFNGFCSGHLSVIHNRDIFVRLPCPEELYESNSSSETPFFHNDILDTSLIHSDDRASTGSMAYLALISSAWGDVLHNIYCLRYHRSDTYEAEYEKFYTKTQSRLSDWMASLPRHLVYSEANIDLSIKEGYIGTFISLQTLYHTTLMKLNRHVCSEHLSPQSIHQNVKAARHHALELLRITSALTKADRQKRLPTADLNFAFSTPFTGYAIMSAVEILTAAGLIRCLPGDLLLFKSGLSVIEELAGFWNSARQQQQSIQRRLEDVGTMVISQVGNVAYRTLRPMEMTFGLENDLFYNMSTYDTFDAMGLGSIVEENRVAIVAGTGSARPYV